MSAGVGIENMYKKYGENNETLIALIIDISANDTEDEIYAKYLQSSGITPTFPIVMNPDGAEDLAVLFGSPSSGGPTWIVMPDREYTRTSYTEPTMSNDIDDALGNVNINFNSTYKPVTFNNTNIAFSQVNKSGFIIEVLKKGVYSISFYSVNGKRKATISNKNLSAGLHGIKFEKGILSQGLYIVGIDNGQNVMRAKVIIK
jgi:hypothetical protein